MQLFYTNCLCVDPTIVKCTHVNKKPLTSGIEAKTGKTVTNKSLLPKNKQKTAKKMFCRENIINAMRKVPPLPKQLVQDTRNGHVTSLIKSGMTPTYVNKKVHKKLSSE